MISDYGEEVFFDSFECLSSDESVSGVGYEIWRNEPQSVRERRERFMCTMGFETFDDHSSKEIDLMGLDRINEYNGAVSSFSISSFSSSSSCIEGNLVCSGREVEDEANVMVDELDKPNLEKPNSASSQEVTSSEAKKLKSWWRSFINTKIRGGMCKSDDVSVMNSIKPRSSRLKVRHNKKRGVEFTAVYLGQEIQAHEGFIWAMKFSPDGQFLASGGEDGVVRIWRVTSVDASTKCANAKGSFVISKAEEKKKSSHCAPVVIPEKVFQIEERPLQELHGHSSDVLDLAWSKSNCLLSSSKDKTVRLWQMGNDECLNVFHHNDYVTCIQFDPIDDSYFISGSIDGKVRIWGVSERRVVDWADVRDVVTAVCYQPDGKGFIVGSTMGSCRFYSTSGNNLQLDAEIYIQGRRKSSSNKITGIQFSREESQRVVMITSEDSKLRIFDGKDVVYKYKGLRKSGSQMSASFTSDGRHIISVGEDSRIYVWNYDSLTFSPSKQTKSVRSCEHFFFQDVSVAIPWSNQTNPNESNRVEVTPRSRESDRFSLGSWFSLESGPCSRGSATWPEEKLPLWDLPFEDLDKDKSSATTLSETWGLVIVTAGWDGIIRTVHNYGLPVRL